MKRTIIALILFFLQLYIILKGASHFSKLQTPFILFFISILLPAYFLYILLREQKEAHETKLFSIKNILTGGGLAALSFVLCYNSIRAAFDLYKDYGGMSDVIPQLETLYQRFIAGTFPYAPLEQFVWHPYPVYMPLNWLPVGLASALHCDVRWIGILFLTVAAVVWGAYAQSSGKNKIVPALAIMLPALVMCAYIQWNKDSFAATLETLVAAYYLLLATGLASRNLVLTTLGIICCLLSRYTMVFWLPLFLLLLWWNVPKKKNMLVWASVIGSVVLLYLPFYLQDTSIISKGIAYHNNCYVDAWNGLGHPEESVAFDDGLNFSWFIREYTSGTMEHRVMIGRIIQGLLMLLLLGAGVVGYKKWKHKINFYDYSLVILYIFLLFFFMFSPLTYKYYYMAFMMVSAGVCGRIVLNRNP